MKKVSPFLFENLGSQQGRESWRRGWLGGASGLSMSFLVLFGLLMGAFLSGSMLIAGVVEEPLRMTEHLNFDYTKPSPDALVPVGSCNGGLCSGGKAGAWERRGWRLVPPNQKLQSTTSLTWPESDYNQKLGVFQKGSRRLHIFRNQRVKRHINARETIEGTKGWRCSMHPLMLLILDNHWLKE